MHATIQGRLVPDTAIGELVEAQLRGHLSAQLQCHGHLLLRGVHDADEVLAARHGVLARLAEVDEIAAPAEAAIATGRSRRAALHPDVGAFWKSVDIAIAYGARLLTTAFAPGDYMVFGMFTVHGAFDNSPPGGRVRISCDTRFQPASEPMDKHFAGPNPPAHGGEG